MGMTIDGKNSQITKLTDTSIKCTSDVRADGIVTCEGFNIGQLKNDLTINSIGSNATLTFNTLNFNYTTDNWLALPALEISNLIELPYTKLEKPYTEMYYYKASNLDYDYLYIIVGELDDDTWSGKMVGLFYYDDYIDNGSEDNPLYAFTVPTACSNKPGVVIVSRGEMNWTSSETTWQDRTIYFWFRATNTSEGLTYSSDDVKNVHIYKVPLKLQITNWSQLKP